MKPTKIKLDFPSEVNYVTTPPWGYEILDRETKTARVITEAVEVLEEALNRLENGESLRAVETWMRSQHRPLTAMGLLKKWREYCPESEILRERELAKVRRKKALKKFRSKAEHKAEEKILEKKSQAAAEKKKITAAKKRLAKLEEKQEELTEVKDTVKKLFKTPIVEDGQFDVLPPPAKQELENNRTVVFEPNKGPQSAFLAAPQLEVLFGGAAGGGKSYALIADPMRYFENKNFVGLLLRRTNDELRELVWKTKELYPAVFKGAKYSEKASEWRFPSGARLWMSYLDRDEDVLRYQGQAYSWIGFDELTHWPSPYPWDYLRTRLRAAKGSGMEDHLSMRGTTNPGGPGHGWVKKMFIDPAPPGEEFWAKSLETEETLVDSETGDPLFKRIFIPSKLSDNPYLAEDGVYRRNLSAMGEARRRQLLEGDWAVADGAAFPEFDQNQHIIKPFEIDPNWTKFRAADYGYASFSAVLWFAIDPQDEQLVVYRELYTSKTTGESLSQMVMDLEQGERINYGMLDSSVWHKRGEGPSVAEVMIQKGCRWRPSDRSAGSRVAGKNRLHELLKFDEETGRPGIVFFNNCRQIISDLPVIPSDPKGTDDIDPRYLSDHSYDALRYGIMSRPKTNFFNTGADFTPIAPVDSVFGY